MDDEDKIQEVEDALDGITTIDRLLLMIGEYMGWNGDISHVYVSDLSQLGNFNIDDHEVVDLSQKLGFRVEFKDCLVDIVKKIEEKKKKKENKS